MDSTPDLRNDTLNPIALLLLALSMSADAFSVAITKGASLKTPRFSQALKIGLIFGAIEASTPVIGWFIGHSAAGYVEAWDHWIAFFLLSGIGLHMLHEGLTPVSRIPVPKPNPSLLKTILTAFGTSVDAMAVGISLAFTDVNIYLAATLIGLATTIMVTTGIMIGKLVGAMLGGKSEILGGLTLVAMAGWILSSHL